MGTGVGTKRSRGAIVGALVLLGAFVVVGILVAGPIRTGTPPWSPQPARLPRFAGPSLPPETAVPPAVSHQHASAVPSTLAKLLIVLAIIAACVIVFLLLRMLRRRRARTAPLTIPLELLPAIEPESAPVPEPDPAPAITRGIARALQELDIPREPHDAIVAAWLGLQEAAADSGVTRRAAETPGEYTARIVGRIGADRDAAARLLRLYQDVRFGAHPVSAADVGTARRCLLLLRESWSTA